MAPLVRVEFARESADKRITLVIVNGQETALVRVLWSLMELHELKAAQEALRLREGTSKDKLEHIATWQASEAAPAAIPSLPDWASARGVDAAIWTALPPKIAGQERTPSETDVVAHLQSLRGAERDNAERYVRLAPRQIDTPYRRRIEAELGWTTLDAWPQDR